MGRSGAVTQRDIAEKLGLSIKAVSAGLAGTGRLNERTRRLIRATAEQLGYVPNAAARALVTRRSNFLAVLFPYTNFSFFGNIIAGIEEVAAEHGYALLLDSLSKTAPRQASVIANLRQRGVDGVIMYPQKEFLALSPKLAALQIPLVQVMHSFVEFGTHAVTVDNFDGARQVAEYLFKQGYRQLAMLTHDAVAPELAERQRGFVETLLQHELTLLDAVPCAIDFKLAQQATARLLSSFPQLEAIFAASDVAALGAMAALQAAGRQVPQEVAVVGFDNLDIAARQLEHPLTTVDQPKEEIGRRAAEMCINLISGQSQEPQVLIPPLIIRQSA